MPLNLNLTIPNRAVHIFVAFVVLFLAGSVIAYAVSPGLVPNPGHALSAIQGYFSGDVSLEQSLEKLQQRVAGTCAVGSSIRVINVDGTVSCEDDSVGVAGLAGSGTANYLAKWSGVTSLGNSVLFERVRTGSNWVGIGTSSPQRVLHLYDSADPAVVFDTGGTDWYFGLDDSDSDKFKIGTGTGVGSNTKMTFTTGGTVNIWDGSASASYATGAGELYVEHDLEVDGDIYAGDDIDFASSGAKITGDDITFDLTEELSVCDGSCGTKNKATADGDLYVESDVEVDGQICLGNVCKSSWPSSGITGVTAGTGLSGGGTSGNVTLNLNPPTTTMIGGVKAVSCPNGEGVKTIQSDGTPVCSNMVVDSYTISVKTQLCYNCAGTSSDIAVCNSNYGVENARVTGSSCSGCSSYSIPNSYTLRCKVNTSHQGSWATCAATCVRAQ